MMQKPDFDAEGALRHNVADVLENGPRLAYGRRTAYAARCSTGKHVLETGLGGMGVGSMWETTPDEVRSAPEFQELPIETCSEFGISDMCPLSREELLRALAEEEQSILQAQQRVAEIEALLTDQTIVFRVTRPGTSGTTTVHDGLVVASQFTPDPTGRSWRSFRAELTQHGYEVALEAE